jgi:hypothetical protein
MKPHMHREAIKAWADGARIQYRPSEGGAWADCLHAPEWSINNEYRAKPDYPASAMTVMELRVAARSAMIAGGHSAAWHAVANAALRHACDHGQVVRREEFDRALADAEARHAMIANAAIQEAASIIESMAMGLNVTLADMLAVTAERVRGTSINDIVRKAVA